MYREYSEMSAIRFNEQLQVFEVDMYPVFSRDQPTAEEEPESSPLPFPLGHRCTGLDLLRDVRSRFPKFAVVFRDRNVDEDIFIRVDISTPSLQKRIQKANGPETFGKHRIGKRVPYLIANVEELDLLGLADGLVMECPPAVFFYCASVEGTSSEDLVRALDDSSDETSLICELVRCCDILLSTGPDAYYFTLRSREESFLREIIGSSE